MLKLQTEYSEMQKAPSCKYLRQEYCYISDEVERYKKHLYVYNVIKEETKCTCYKAVTTDSANISHVNLKKVLIE
jgi:hypothetical protein